MTDDMKDKVSAAYGEMSAALRLAVNKTTDFKMALTLLFDEMAKLRQENKDYKRNAERRRKKA